jgi:hypothetical protein
VAWQLPEQETRRSFSHGEDRSHPVLPPFRASSCRHTRLSASLYDEAVKDSWMVISMKKDWKRIIAFDE